jgi:GNAT superfamily N-acetyltransferase
MRGRGWVIEIEGTIVGFAIANATDGNVWALFVHPEHERRGYGWRLHDAMVSWLWEQGVSKLWLTTDPDTRARRFYEAAGWSVVGFTSGGQAHLELHEFRT